MTPKFVFLAHNLIYPAASSSSSFWVLNRYLTSQTELLLTPKCTPNIVFPVSDDDKSVLLADEVKNLGVHL